jgi:hypothetical protein
MIAVLLSALFAGTGILAAAAIAASLRRYGAAARALPAQLAACGQWREARVTLSEVRVGRNATVLRPNFTAAARNRSGCPSVVLPEAA